MMLHWYFADEIFNRIFLKENLTEICFSGSNWQYVRIGSGNGLAPTRRQAITWINADPIHWRIYGALGEDELNISKVYFYEKIQDF